MSFLDGGIASVMAAAFEGVYRPATLYRSARYDDGFGSVSVSQTGEAVRAQIDVTNEAMRQQPGYTDTDVRILILASGVDLIDTDCEIVLGGTRYLIASVAQDPAGSYFDCRGQRR